MDDGFTGVNFEKNYTDYKNFFDKADIACQSLYDCFYFLFSELYYIWCSPNAVSFSKKYNGKVCNFFLDVIDEFDTLACNIMLIIDRFERINGISTSIYSYRLEPFDSYKKFTEMVLCILI